MESIGAGPPRTATMSRKLALEMVGMGPCYHMQDMFINLVDHLPLWEEARHERWNDEVRSTVPAERLLEWRPQDGWEPLCELPRGGGPGRAGAERQRYRALQAADHRRRRGVAARLVAVEATGQRLI